MLYDPKWAPAETKPDVFSLDSLIAWLEKQPADKVYCYYDNGGCVLHSYLSAMGQTNVWVGGFEYSSDETDGELTDLLDPFVDIAMVRPHTFGAALQRARAARVSPSL